MLVLQILTILPLLNLQEAGGAVKKMEQELSEKQKVDAKAQSNLNHKKDGLKAEQKKLKDTTKHYENVRTLKILVSCYMIMIY
jgi:FtsZ-binding cell division protein ZapB